MFSSSRKEKGGSELKQVSNILTRPVENCCPTIKRNVRIQITLTRNIAYITKF
jgi:hypothetical protein